MQDKETDEGAAAVIYQADDDVKNANDSFEGGED